MIVWGRGTLAKVKEGAKRKVSVKRESLLTGMSGGVIPSWHSRTCMYLYRLRQGGSYTKWPLEALRLNDNRLYDTPVNLQIAIWQMFRTF